MTIKNGKISIKSKQPVKVDFIPAKVNLKAVTNRSRVYHPPKLHLEKPLPGIEPIHIAEAGLLFYENLLKQVEEYFVN